MSETGRVKRIFVAQQTTSSRRTMSTTAAALRLGVPVRTLRAWLEKYPALFPASYRSPGGWWRVDTRDVAALLERRATRCVEDS